MRFRLALIFLAASAAIAEAQPLDAAAACTKTRMEVDPTSVEEPCTELLSRPGLSAAQLSLAYYIRGRGRHRSQRIPLAKPDYDEALRLDPSNSDIYVDRANISLRQGRGIDAVADLEQSLARDAKNARALVSFGAILLAQNEEDQGLAVLETALDIDPRQPFGLYFRSQHLHEIKRRADALRDAEALVAIGPEALNRYGFVDEQGVLQDFFAVALVARGNVLWALNEKARAEADFDAAVARSPIVVTLRTRGWHLLNVPGREEDALRDLDAARDIDPASDLVNLLRGKVLLRLKRWSEAVDAFSDSLHYDGEGAETHHLRSQALRQLGRHDQAVHDQIRSAELDRRFILMSLPPLFRAGYLPVQPPPKTMTPEIADAMRACALDPSCRKAP